MNNTNLDQMIPDCLHWESDDFQFLRVHAKLDNEAVQAAKLIIRRDNLQLLSGMLKEHDITFWLFGKTLLGLFRNNEFLVHDHDDDIGVFCKDYVRVCTKLYPLLKKKGFRAIRHNNCMLTIIRNNRYIDICFFEEKGDKIGYGEKWVPKKYFESFGEISYHGQVYPVPNESDKLLDLLYPKKEGEYGISFSNFLRQYHRRIKRKIKKYKRIASEYFLHKRIVRPLSYEEFMECKIEADNAINWLLRSPHLSLITDNGNNRKICEIVKFYKDRSNLEEAKKNINEVDTSEVFDEPINLNNKFWLSGNNLLFYCLYYGFRKGVLPYSKVNEYISEVNKPALYSAEYFESLPQMNDEEIIVFVKEHPITIYKGAIEHGKHRACVMIGRLISGKEYIPLYIEERIPRFKIW